MKQNIGTINALIRITLGLVSSDVVQLNLYASRGALGLTFFYGLVQ